MMNPVVGYFYVVQWHSDGHAYNHVATLKEFPLAEDGSPRLASKWKFHGWTYSGDREIIRGDVVRPIICNVLPFQQYSLPEIAQAILVATENKGVCHGDCGLLDTIFGAWKPSADLHPLDRHKQVLDGLSRNAKSASPLFEQYKFRAYGGWRRSFYLTGHGPK